MAKRADGQWDRSLGHRAVRVRAPRAVTHMVPQGWAAQEGTHSSYLLTLTENVFLW